MTEFEENTVPDGEPIPSIVNHRLTYATWDPDDEPTTSIVPLIIVAHYTVSRTAKGTAATFKAKDYLSCHLTCDRDGSMIQQVPFNQKARHAGESSWNGKPRCNDFSIGVEMVSPGPLKRWAPGSAHEYTDVYGNPWTEGVVEGRHKNPGCSWKYWAEYSDEQVDAFIRVCAELMAAYPTIVDIVGHDDIAPSRKTDPGPAFPWGAIRSALRLGDTEPAPPLEE
jgi:N-acetylmuramoyl-L-alanine amidase